MTSSQQNQGPRSFAASMAELTASEAAARITDGSLTAEAYASGLLEVFRANADLNAFTYLDEARVLDAARHVDQRRARGEPLGILAGIPLAVKDNIDTVGFPTSASTAALKDNHALQDAPVVAALQRKGAYVFGKANMHELAGGGTSSNPTFGAVGNPYDRSRVAGGSSGGTAAAVAARIVPVGLGTDTAGSVRIPSAFCGTVALRPSIMGGSRYSLDGVVPLSLDLDTIGPMARSVADLTLMHSAITDAPQPKAAQLKNVRIGVPLRYYWEGLDPEVERVSRQALLRLKDAGVTLVEIDIGQHIANTDEIFWTLLNAGMRDDLAKYFKDKAIKLDVNVVIDAIASQDTRCLFQMARDASLPAEVVATARGAGRERIGKTYDDLFRVHRLDAIAFPTEPLLAPRISASGDTFEDEVEVGGKNVSKLQILIHHTRFTCALGVPGLSLTAGLSATGLPVGLELDGRAGADVDLLGLGLAAEAEIGRLSPPDLRLGS